MNPAIPKESKDSVYKKFHMNYKPLRYTPETITTLQPNEIFVFGSNLAGKHGKGAALDATRYFGAVYGKGEGLHGRSYAFPTLDEEFEKLNIEKLYKSVRNLYTTCEQNPNLTFLLTKVGTGLAGFSEHFMSSLFYNPRPDNLVFPKGW